jgi:hypothetical protein
MMTEAADDEEAANEEAANDEAADTSGRDVRGTIAKLRCDCGRRKNNHVQ